MILQKVNRKDVLSVYRRMSDYFMDKFDFTLRQLLDEECFIFILKDDLFDEIIYSSIRRLGVDEETKLPLVDFDFSLCDKAYRGQKIGKKMFEETITYFKEYLKKDFLIRISVRETNIPSKTIIEKNDFELYKEETCTFNEKDVKFLYYKKLIKIS